MVGSVRLSRAGREAGEILKNLLTLGLS
jgi:hypothetical protein